MKRALKISLYVLAGLAVIAFAGIAYLKWALPNVGPAPELTIEITPERLERGKYLANHVMLCMDCHAERDWNLFSGPPQPGTEGAGGDRFVSPYHDGGAQGWRAHLSGHALSELRQNGR